MSTISPEDILRDPEARKDWERSQEAARQYLREFKCPSCHSKGTVRTLKTKVSAQNEILGSCTTCSTVVVLNPQIMLDGLWGTPFSSEFLKVE